MPVHLHRDRGRASVSTQVRTRRQNSMGDVVVDICYRMHDQKDKVDEAFFRQLEEDSLAESGLHGDF